ncbi:MAG TPA: transcriptional regulator [Peptococcaceae bacterium]|nr:transcriptional regulator [Peptococcaceae bacterium]
MKTRGKVIVSILVILGLALGAGAWWINKSLFGDPLVTQTDPNTGKSIQAFNVLLLGSDARPGEKTGRTDTIIVAQVSKDRISMLSIPRDTRVDIPGHGKQKLNAAAFFEGPETTADIVSDIIGQPVNKYILVRWEGFMDIVDALGGVDVEIPKDIISYSLDGSENRVDLKKGVQHLNGKEALAFMRYRKEAQGDIYRVGNQLDFMKVLASKCIEPSTILKLPKVLPEIYKNVETNIDLKELLVLAKAGMNFKDNTILTQTLPGYFLNIDGVSYWGFDPSQAHQVTYDLFYNGVTTSKVVMATPSELNSSSQSTQVAQQPEEDVFSPPVKEEVKPPPPIEEEQPPVEEGPPGENPPVEEPVEPPAPETPEGEQSIVEPPVDPTNPV